MIPIREIIYKAGTFVEPVQLKNVFRIGDQVQMHSSPEYWGEIKKVYGDTVDVKWVWSDKIERVKAIRLDKR